MWLAAMCGAWPSGCVREWRRRRKKKNSTKKWIPASYDSFDQYISATPSVVTAATIATASASIGTVVIRVRSASGCCSSPFHLLDLTLRSFASANLEYMHLGSLFESLYIPPYRHFKIRLLLVKAAYYPYTGVLYPCTCVPAPVVPLPCIIRLLTRPKWIVVIVVMESGIWYTEACPTDPWSSSFI